MDYPDLNAARQQLQEAGRYMLENSLAWGNAGNISARIAPDRYMITASGTRLGELADDDLIEMELDAPTLKPGSGVRKPSKETPMHRAVYEVRPEINAVLHASPFYSTLIACSQIDLPTGWFVEAMYYLERIERVPYAHPGSVALGEGVRAKAGLANVLLLENHGVLVYDYSVREALMGLHTLEMACRMYLSAKSAQVELGAIPEGTVQDFLENSGYRARRAWPETR